MGDLKCYIRRQRTVAKITDSYYIWRHHLNFKRNQTTTCKNVNTAFNRKLPENACDYQKTCLVIVQITGNFSQVMCFRSAFSINWTLSCHFKHTEMYESLDFNGSLQYTRCHNNWFMCYKITRNVSEMMKNPIFYSKELNQSYYIQL